MTWFLISVSCRISGNLWDKHPLIFCPSKNYKCITECQEISAVQNFYLLLSTNTQHQTDVLYILGWGKTPADCNHTQYDSSRVQCPSLLLLVPFWLEANYMFLRTSHFLSLTSSSPILHQPIIAIATTQYGESGSEMSQSMRAPSNGPVAGTQRQYRYVVVHPDAANVAMEYMIENPHWKVIQKTGYSKNKTQNADRCEYIHIEVNSCRLSI